MNELTLIGDAQPDAPPKVVLGRKCDLKSGGVIELLALDDGSVQLCFKYQGRETPLRLSAVAMASLVAMWFALCQEPKDGAPAVET